jgi:hypothetical protein
VAAFDDDCPQKDLQQTIVVVSPSRYVCVEQGISIGPQISMGSGNTERDSGIDLHVVVRMNFSVTYL